MSAITSKNVDRIIKDILTLLPDAEVETVQHFTIKLKGADGETQTISDTYYIGQAIWKVAHDRAEDEE